MAQARTPRAERGWQFPTGGYTECDGRNESKCLREKEIPGSLTGTFPDLTAKAGDTYESKSLLGPLLAATTAYKKKCPKEESAQACPMQLVFPPDVGPALRLCPEANQPGEVIPVRSLDAMIPVERSYCGCIDSLKADTKVKCARGAKRS